MEFGINYFLSDFSFKNDLRSNNKELHIEVSKNSVAKCQNVLEQMLANNSNNISKYKAKCSVYFGGQFRLNRGSYNLKNSSSSPKKTTSYSLIPLFIFPHKYEEPLNKLGKSTFVLPKHPKFQNRF